MKTILFAATFGMLGCGYDLEVTPADPPPPKIGIWVEDGISARWAGAACDTWAAVGISCVPATDRDSALVVISDSGEVGCEPAGGIVWAGSGGRGWVQMHMGCYPEENPVDSPTDVAELAHELGHAFGCGHITAPGAVMNPDAYAQRITEDDILEYRRANPTP